MNNLLFTVLLIVLIYYFFYYLPQQKSHLNPNPIINRFTHPTETEPSLQPIECPSATILGPDAIPDPQIIQKLEADIHQKEQTIIGLNNSYDKLELKKKQEIELLRKQKEDSVKQIDDLKKQLTNLQTQVRDLAKRPLKPTNSKSSQTDELTSTLDTLIKEMQDLNNSL